MNPIRAALLLTLLLTAPLGRADWINLTGSETAPNIAEIYVMDDHVRLVLEVYIGDLEKFTELIPDAWMAEAQNRPSMQQRIETFAAQRFRFVTETGEALPARLELVEPRLRVDQVSTRMGYSNRRYGVGVSTRTHVREYTQGTLAIDIIDASGQDLLWRGVSRRSLGQNRTPEEKDRDVMEIVTAILQKFPP